MKKAVGICLIIVLSLVWVPCARARATNLDKVEEMLIAMGMDEAVDSTVTQMLYDLFVTTPEFDIHQDILLDYTMERVSWEVLKDDIIKIYADEFTDAEIAELTRFYSSGVGQKLVKLSPDMSSKIRKLVKQRFDSDLDLLEMQMKNREMDLLEEENVFFQGEGDEQ